MLIKKKLEKIPIQAIRFDEIDKLKKTVDRYVNAYISNVDGCGEILTVDFYDSKKDLIFRFFSDKKNGITLIPNGKWHTNQIEVNQYFKYEETQGSIKNTQNFFKYKYPVRTRKAINLFISDIERKKRWKAEENKEKRMKEHLTKFTGYPNDFDEYCNKNVFENRYMIFKRNRKFTEAECLHCGKKFTLKGILKHRKGFHECPACKSKCIPINRTWIGSIKDKAKICIITKQGNDLITVWSKLERTYGANGKCHINKDEYFYDVLIDNQKRYYYAYYCGHDWRKVRFSNEGDETYLYTNNLNEVYENGVTSYDLDLKKLKGVGRIDLIGLINASAMYETARTLFKIRLYKLAEYACMLNAGEKFHEVLGVNKAYLPLMQKFNVSFGELKLIRMADITLNEELFEKLIRLSRKSGLSSSSLNRMLKHMTYEKAINYLTKQAERHSKNKAYTLVTWYCDYIYMVGELNNSLPDEKKIDLKTTKIRYPRDIKQAHDGASNKLTVLKEKKLEASIRKLHDKYDKKYSFESGTLLVKYPEGLEDFIREGTTLSHCVGNNPHYARAHSAESEITIFVRKKEDTEKPYYTATFYTKDFKLRECYGKSHKNPPQEIQTFLKKYAAFMKKAYLIKQQEVA